MEDCQPRRDSTSSLVLKPTPGHPRNGQAPFSLPTQLYTSPSHISCTSTHAYLMDELRFITITYCDYRLDTALSLTHEYPNFTCIHPVSSRVCDWGSRPPSHTTHATNTLSRSRYWKRVAPPSIWCLVLLCRLLLERHTDSS